MASEVPGPPKPAGPGWPLRFQWQVGPALRPRPAAGAGGQPVGGARERTPEAAVTPTRTLGLRDWRTLIDAAQDPRGTRDTWLAPTPSPPPSARV